MTQLPVPLGDGSSSVSDSCQWALGSGPDRNLVKFGQSTRLPGCRFGTSPAKCLWNAQCEYLLSCQTHLKPHFTLPSLACLAFPGEGRASSPEIHRLKLGPSAANERASSKSHSKSMRTRTLFLAHTQLLAARAAALRDK